MIKHNGIFWKLTKIRKQAPCVKCGALIEPFTKAYRPNYPVRSNTNRDNARRKLRVCLDCGNAMAAL